MFKFCYLNFKRLFQIILLTCLIIQLNSCGLYRPTDARKIPPNASDRVKKNQEEGKGMRFGSLLGKNQGGDFQFASSNPMWRATIEVLDFVPLTNVDYGGGIIVTDWYGDSTSTNESIKIMVQFLSNEIRSDGIKINIYKKDCLSIGSCQTQILETELNIEIKLAILKKAASLKKETLTKKK
tara:strand:+ start:410 stop:955 length:546 start_codon:yes stop_codon:yes gene_type:complete